MNDDYKKSVHVSDALHERILEHKEKTGKPVKLIVAAALRRYLNVKVGK